jgi:hypothetical protein
VSLENMVRGSWKNGLGWHGPSAKESFWSREMFDMKNSAREPT